MSEYTIMKNKGKYSLESGERALAFEEKKAVGWVDEYKEYRKNWIQYPENNIVSEFPLNIDIELTTLCNLKCPMCFTTTKEYDKFRKKEFMDFSLFKKIIDEIANKVPAIRFSSSGEQTLYPDFIKCISYAKNAGIKEISMVTNASLLSLEFIEKLILAGVDWIIISVDGMHETYEKIRYPMKFEQVVETLQNIKLIKEKYNIEKPVIQIQSIWPAIEKNYQDYYEMFLPLTDLIQFGSLIDYEKADKLIYEENFCCPALYQRMEVGFDGKVYPCCANNGERLSIGNIKENSLHNIWHGETLNKLRKLHEEQNGFKKIAMCKDCFLSRKMEVKEVHQLNGQEFQVKGYVYKE